MVIDALALTNSENGSTSNVVLTLHEAMVVEGFKTVGSTNPSSRVDIPIGGGLRLNVVFANTTSSPSVTFNSCIFVKN